MSIDRSKVDKLVKWHNKIVRFGVKAFQRAMLSGEVPQCVKLNSKRLWIHKQLSLLFLCRESYISTGLRNIDGIKEQNSRGFIKTCERRRDGKNVNMPRQKISWPGRETSVSQPKNREKIFFKKQRKILDAR